MCGNTGDFSLFRQAKIIVEKEIFMSIFKQLWSISRRIDKVTREVDPPTLRMVVIDENKGEELPAQGTLTEWDLLLKMEKKCAHS